MTPALTAVVDEASELYCDKAEGIPRDALESENELRRDVASRFVLSGKGAPRPADRFPAAIRGRGAAALRGAYPSRFPR